MAFFSSFFCFFFFFSLCGSLSLSRLTDTTLEGCGATTAGDSISILIGVVVVAIVVVVALFCNVTLLSSSLMATRFNDRAGRAGWLVVVSVVVVAMAVVVPNGTHRRFNPVFCGTGA